MTPDWHGPVSAVLDAFGLYDVTLVGISLGGCLVMHAAASEPRVRRVVAWDTLTDFYTCMTRTLPPALRMLADKAVNADAESKFELALHDAAANSPFLD